MKMQNEDVKQRWKFKISNSYVSKSIIEENTFEKKQKYFRR